MSWELDGVIYHFYSEYQAAKRRREETRALREAEVAQRNFQRLRDRLRENEEKLQRVDNDLDEQVRINEVISNDVKKMGRIQDGLRQSQERFEKRTQANLRNIQSDAQATREDIREFKRRHEADIAGVERTFRAVRSELNEGLREAEERRLRTERLLQEEVSKVDNKIEEDRRARLAVMRDERERAKEAISMVEVVFREIEQELGRLGLVEERQAIDEQMSVARASLQRNDSSAALAIAEGAFGQTRNLQYRCRSRRAKLRGYIDDFKGRAREIQEQVSNDRISDWFANELGEVQAILEHFESRIDRRYNRFERAELEAVEDEKIIEGLESSLEAMVVSAPEIAQQVDKRLTTARDIIGKLINVYGPMEAAPEQMWAVSGDPKSRLVVKCPFPGAIVSIHLDLDGSYTLDGYGHESNVVCADRARRVVEQLGEERVERQQTSIENREEPAVVVNQARAGWEGIATVLAALREKL